VRQLARWGWGKRVVAGVAAVFVVGRAVLTTYRVWSGMSGGDGMLADASAVGVGAVVVHALLRWGAEAGRAYGGRKLWAWVGGWLVGVAMVATLLAFATPGCRTPWYLWPLWVASASWWAALEWDGSRWLRELRGSVAALSAAILLYSVTVFTVLPWEIGGARRVPAVLHLVDGPAVGEAVRWRSGVWVFGSYCTAVGIGWSPAAGVDVTGLGTSARRIGAPPDTEPEVAKPEAADRHERPIERTVLVSVEELP